MAYDSNDYYTMERKLKDQKGIAVGFAIFLGLAFIVTLVILLGVNSGNTRDRKYVQDRHESEIKDLNTSHENQVDKLKNELANAEFDNKKQAAIFATGPCGYTEEMLVESPFKSGHPVLVVGGILVDPDERDLFRLSRENGTQIVEKRSQRNSDDYKILARFDRTRPPDPHLDRH